MKLTKKVFTGFVAHSLPETIMFLKVAMEAQIQGEDTVAE